MSNTYYPGKPFPLGATWDGAGVNFAIYSDNATGVELCLFEKEDDKHEKVKVRVYERTNDVWHIYIPGLKPGQLYAYRVCGPYEPENGHRFNYHKLLLDPYAKAITGTAQLEDSLFGYDIHADHTTMSTSDSAPHMPRCIVIDPHFDWEGDKPLDIPYHQTIIYEAHVKGLTKLHPGIPKEIRGTYSALAHPVMIRYLKELGITAIELMPVHYFITDRHLYEKGKTNYWGYNTIGYFAPDVRYATEGARGDAVREFKQMVKELHKAGIEVILDVVYNHTGEGNHMGPTLSFRGVDNASYYRLTEDKSYYMDYTGTGNTLNANLPSVLRLIMDSLRYWILDMHVDGFRFDLAATLARELHEVDRLSAFFDIIHQDPVISQVKLIAEPWDVGEGGYQVGKFPPGWAEWNGKYRDCMRDFWRGADSMLSEFAERFTGSSDLYKGDYRRPHASINFITAHDGFTLRDLVSYNEKHNMDNGEDNKDGESHNRSYNYGVEGPTDDPAINEIRKRQQKNFLTTLILSQGIPMIVAGDEAGKTQNGNNNAYCQDNEISWINWKHTDDDMLQFTRKLLHFHNDHPVFSRKKWFKGIPIKGIGLEDIAWFQPNGAEMTEENWKQDYAKSLAVFLNGKALRTIGPKGEQVMDDSFYIIFNAFEGNIQYKLPSDKFGTNWILIIDTAKNFIDENGNGYKPGDEVEVAGRSVVVLKNPLE